MEGSFEPLATHLSSFTSHLPPLPKTSPWRDTAQQPFGAYLLRLFNGRLTYHVCCSPNKLLVVIAHLVAAPFMDRLAPSATLVYLIFATRISQAILQPSSEHVALAFIAVSLYIPLALCLESSTLFTFPRVCSPPLSLTSIRAAVARRLTLLKPKYVLTIPAFSFSVPCSSFV
jgi:hypothetical protein